jgi:hypothetical protein
MTVQEMMDLMMIKPPNVWCTVHDCQVGLNCAEAPMPGGKTMASTSHRYPLLFLEQTACQNMTVIHNMWSTVYQCSHGLGWYVISYGKFVDCPEGAQQRKKYKLPFPSLSQIPVFYSVTDTKDSSLQTPELKMYICPNMRSKTTEKRLSEVKTININFNKVRAKLYVSRWRRRSCRRRTSKMRKKTRNAVKRWRLPQQADHAPGCESPPPYGHTLP